MSKRLKNYPSPTDMINSYGADALRLYLINSPVVRGEPLKFNQEHLRDVVKVHYRKRGLYIYIYIKCQCLYLCISVFLYLYVSLYFCIYISISLYVSVYMMLYILSYIH